MSGKSIEYNNSTEVILDHIIPHLHQALTRILGKHNKKLITLSQREIEILKWLKDGKGTWDIARILGISERTVNFHIYNIMKKLDAVNRAQAVAIAMELGLIDID